MKLQSTYEPLPADMSMLGDDLAVLRRFLRPSFLRKNYPVRTRIMGRYSEGSIIFRRFHIPGSANPNPITLTHSNPALPACLSYRFLGNRSLKTTFVVSFPGIRNLRNIEPSKYRTVTRTRTSTDGVHAPSSRSQSG